MRQEQLFQKIIYSTSFGYKIDLSRGWPKSLGPEGAIRIITKLCHIVMIMSNKKVSVEEFTLIL